MSTQKIVTFLWFNNNAEEAVNFYVSLFKNSKIKNVSYYGEGAPMPKGTVLVASFELEGQSFFALNGGPQYQFTPAISLMINCDTQEEVDELWDKLTDGGKPGRCGWLTDKFGLSWQVTPKRLNELLGDKDRARAGRAMQAMMTMNKIDIPALERAANGE